MSQSSHDRRAFLQTGFGALAGTALPARFGEAGPRPAVQREPMSPAEFRKRLEGPILSFPTPYRADFEIDYPAVRMMIERALAAGVSVCTLTSGNNEYDFLGYDEIKKLTTVMVEAAAGKGITLASTGAWWRGMAVDYARFAQSAGADGIQVRLPAVGDDEGLFEHVREVSRAVEIGLVIHGQPSRALMRRLMTIDSVVGFKEEFTSDYTVPLFKEFGDRLNIFAGGTKARLMDYRPYGMRAYYSAFATFAPEIGMRFWNAVRKDDMKGAREIIYRYDIPFFDRWSRPFWHATLEAFGVARRFARPPERTFSDREMSDVKSFYEGLKLAPG